jgi:hypothetical protein
MADLYNVKGNQTSDIFSPTVFDMIEFSNNIFANTLIDFCLIDLIKKENFRDFKNNNMPDDIMA